MRVAGGGGFGRDASRSASSARPIARNTSDTATTHATPKSANATALPAIESPAKHEHRHGGEQQADDAEDQTAHASHLT